MQKGAKDTAYINPVNNIKIEMQPHLIDMGYSEWYEYLQDIWEKCSNDKHEYKMNLEDFYIYHIIHMAKHFKNGGIGLNHILDIHVMNLTFKPMDWNYIENELLKINLYKFNLTMQALVSYWFNNKNTINFSKEEMEIIQNMFLPVVLLVQKNNRRQIILLREEIINSLIVKNFFLIVQ